MIRAALASIATAALGSFVLAFPLIAAEDGARLAPGIAGATFPIASSAPAAMPAPAVQPVSYSALLERVMPAVVSVFPAQLIKEGTDDEGLERFFGHSKEDADKQHERNQGLGSGVILTADGWIVTNSHVVHLPSGKIADSISVELSDRRRLPAQIAGADPATDLALIKIKATGLPALPIGDSDAVKIGDLVFAVGNPFKVGMTATMGIVSAKRRTIDINGPGGFEDFIQTDAAINPGNSGGSLVDASGRLIGINSAIYGAGGGGNVGIGFAIPSNLMRAIIIRLAEEGTVRRGFFGMQTEDLDADTAAAAKLEHIAGAKISSLMAGGPAAKAGLAAGDIVLLADGHPVDTRAALRLALSLVKPGVKIALEYCRAGEHKTATITPVVDPNGADGSFELAALPGIQLKAEKDGLTVVSATAEAGRRTQLEAGMVILEINDLPAPAASAAELALRPGVNKIKVRAGDGDRTLAVRIE